MRKIPKPRVNDSVEMCNMSKMFGVVRKIVDDERVLVEWTHEKEVVQIKDLALVERMQTK